MLITSAARAALKPCVAANRHQCDIDRSNRFNFSLGGDTVQVAQVSNCKRVIIKHVKSIALQMRAVSFMLRPFVPSRLNTGNKYTTNLILPRSGNHIWSALNRLQIIVRWGIMADRDDVGCQFQRALAPAWRLIIRIGYHGRRAALSQSETGKSVPSNFHAASNVLCFDYTLKRFALPQGRLKAVKNIVYRPAFAGLADKPAIIFRFLDVFA